MRDLSFQDALEDPALPFRRFVQDCVDLWNRAVEAYEAAGSPNGPVGEGNNVTNWFIDRMDDADAVQAAEELLGFGECDD
jgi:hypothetical protein